MPRSGGEAGKLGDRYEAVWTVDVMLDLLGGVAISLTVESLDDSTGVEFDVVQQNGTRVFHSVKRQTSAKEWSLAKLCSPDAKTGRSILGDLFSKLNAARYHEAVFVSSTGANSLRELHERATQSTSSAEFRKRIAGASYLVTDFEKYIVRLTAGCKVTAFEHLRRIRVSLIDEAQLIRRLEQRIEALICKSDGHPADGKTIRLLLADFVLDHLGTPLASQDIRKTLEPAFILRDWSREVGVQEQVNRINKTYLRHVRADLINGINLAREECKAALSLLTKLDGPRIVLLVAPAGYGKSCLVAQVADLLETQNVPLLCLRLDSYPDAESLKHWGEKLDLPGAPHVVLQNLAQAKGAVLVIDQLDAMSVVSGRNPALWDLFEQLVTDLRAFPNMRILAACRKYDLENDHRLRRIVADDSFCGQVVVADFDLPQVMEILTSSGVDSKQIGEQQLRLLQVPFHLFLFLETLTETNTSFSGITELFERYWEHKRRNVSQRLRRESHWVRVIDAITTYLSDHQVLAVPRRTIEEWYDDVGAMVSEHVLIEEAKSYRFFHESFFDYAYARRFVDTGDDVIEMLLSSEQHLFRRAQIRQILSYVRESDWEDYLQLVDGLLSHPEIRFHIKRVVISGFSRILEPTNDEWSLLSKFHCDDELGSHVNAALRGSLGWFDLLNQRGVLAGWLDDEDDSNADRACWLLSASEIQEHRSEQLASLLEPLTKRGESWAKRLQYLMRWGHVHHSRRMFDIFLQMLGDGIIGEPRQSQLGDWWMILYQMREAKPEYAAEAIGCWLNRRLVLLSPNADGNLLGDAGRRSQCAEQIISQTAKNSPEAFVTFVLPPVVSLIQATAKSNSDGQILDTIWAHRSYSLRLRIESALLYGLQDAMEWMAIESHDRLDAVTSALEALTFDTIEFLFVSAWTANPERYAEKCGQYLLEHRHRLNIEYSSWSDGNGHAAVTRRALQAITPHCSDETLTRLESAILEFIPSWEVLRSRGFTQYLLLQSIDNHRRSRRVLNRIEELKHKFPDIEASLPQRKDGIARVVGSPISPEKTKLMTDDQWLSAMTRYSSNVRDWDRGGKLGGPHELSQLLELETRRDRQRFAELVSKMPNDTNPRYFSAILEGLCGSGTASVSEDEREAEQTDRNAFSTDAIACVIRKLHSLPGRPCGNAISSGVRCLAMRPWPVDVFTIVAWYAEHDPDPSEELWRSDTESGQAFYGGDPECQGINSVRGAAATTISALLFADPNRFETFEDSIHSLISDDSMAVRCCAIDALLPILNVDREKSVTLFQQLCIGAQPVYRTSRFENYVRYAIQTHYCDLRSILLECLTLDDEDAVRNASRQICVASFGVEEASADALIVMSGTVIMRRAAAEVYSRNLQNPSLAAKCATRLPRFFQDEDQEVLGMCDFAFGGVQGESLRANEGLILEFIDSPAFEVQCYYFLQALEDAVTRLPDVVCKAAERLTEHIGSEGSDLASENALNADLVARLIVRLYGQTYDESVRKRCLDLIDIMESHSYFGIDSELQRTDR